MQDTLTNPETVRGDALVFTRPRSPRLADLSALDFAECENDLREPDDDAGDRYAFQNRIDPFEER